MLITFTVMLLRASSFSLAGIATPASAGIDIE